MAVRILRGILDSDASRRILKPREDQNGRWDFPFKASLICSKGVRIKAPASHEQTVHQEHGEI